MSQQSIDVNVKKLFHLPFNIYFACNGIWEEGKGFVQKPRPKSDVGESNIKLKLPVVELLADIFQSRRLE